MNENQVICNLKITENIFDIFFKQDCRIKKALTQIDNSIERKNKSEEYKCLTEEILNLQHQLISIGLIKQVYEQINLEEFYLPWIDLPENDIRFILALFSIQEALDTLKQLCFLQKISPLQIIGDILRSMDEPIILLREHKPFYVFSPLNMTIPPLYFKMLYETASSTLPLLKVSADCLQSVLRRLYVDLKISPVSCLAERNRVTDFQKYLSTLNSEIALQNLRNFHSILEAQIPVV